MSSSHNSLLICILFISLLSLSFQAECGGKPDPNAQPNLNQIYTGKPTLLKQIPNGKLFWVGDQNSTSSYVLHVFGSPYERGFAQGTLLKDEINVFIPQVMDYVYSQAYQINFIKKLPSWLSGFLVKNVLNLALDLTYAITNPYTKQEFYDELKGIADASGVNYNDARNMQLLGALTQGMCSLYGAWDEATANKKTLQFRALDWDITGPFHNFQLITVSHPNQGEGNKFVTVGFMGFVGAITGMNEHQMGISEIGIYFIDDTFGQESRIGNPFTFLLREILQYDTTLNGALARIQNAKRTCNLVLGVGDGKAEAVRAIQYSYSVANVIDDQNLRPVAAWHPQIKDVVYYGMDWLCPGYNSVLGAQIQEFWGNITVENTISNIIAKTQTGDLHVAVYDLTDSIMYFSIAKRDNQTGPALAYQRSFIKLDLNELFAEENN